MSVSFLRSLTVARCGLDMAILEKTALAGESAVLRIAGFIKKTEAKAGNLGPYIEYQGEFAATNLISGSEYRAGKMCLPQIAESALSPELAEGAKLKFALEIGVKENLSKKGGTKYMYTVKPLIEQTEDDELTKLMKSLPDVKAIAAPKKK